MGLEIYTAAALSVTCIHTVQEAWTVEKLKHCITQSLITDNIGTKSLYRETCLQALPTLFFLLLSDFQSTRGFFHFTTDRH